MIQELSIGNYVNVEQTTYKVLEIRQDRIIAQWIGGGDPAMVIDWKPIRLKDGPILAQLGFRYTPTVEYGIGVELWEEWSKKDFNLRKIEGEFYYYSIKVDYVHVLQNLYHLQTKETLVLL